MIITLAWTTIEVHPVPDTGRPDLGIGPKLQSVVTAHACTWALTPQPGDLEQARKYARRREHSCEVYEWPDGHQDPLSASRAKVLEEHGTCPGCTGIIEGPHKVPCRYRGTT